VRKQDFDGVRSREGLRRKTVIASPEVRIPALNQPRNAATASGSKAIAARARQFARRRLCTQVDLLRGADRHTAFQDKHNFP
jgi:hypothetical protein